MSEHRPHTGGEYSSGTGEVFLERPEDFDAEELVGLVSEDYEAILQDSKDLEVMDESMHPSDSAALLNNRMHEQEMLLDRFGASSLHPQAINSLALREVGAPLRFQKSSCKDRPARHISAINPITGTPSENVWEARIPAEIKDRVLLLMFETINYPEGALISDTLRADSSSLRPVDLESLSSYADNIQRRRKYSLAQHQRMIEDGTLQRFFLTQNVLLQNKRGVLSATADLESLIVDHACKREPPILPPDLASVYKDFELRKAGFRAYKMSELVDLQARVYKEILKNTPYLRM